MGFWVYIMECSDGSYYTGHTENLEKRLYEHEKNIIKCHTSRKLPVKLVYSCKLETRLDAITRERQIKGWSRRKKQALVSENWANLIKFSKSNYNRPSTGSVRGEPVEP